VLGLSGTDHDLCVVCLETEAMFTFDCQSGSADVMHDDISLT
jgi:hypothetical protein